MAIPLIVAEIVFASIGSAPCGAEATLSASVTTVGCHSGCPLPVAARTSGMPLLILPLSSFAVTVIVAEPLPAVIDAGAAATSDWLALGAAAVTVTPAVCVMAIPLIVAEIVFASATVELTVPVATPLTSVTTAGCVSVFPLPVAARTTGVPVIRLPFASFAVTVIVAEPLPAVIDAGAAATRDRKSVV